MLLKQVQKVLYDDYYSANYILLDKKSILHLQLRNKRFGNTCFETKVKMYEIITKNQPIFEKSSTKNVRYTIEDNFFCFWFRFIYKYNYMLEIENYDAVKTIINRDYETFSGKMLERYFKRVLMESKAFTRIGSWWDRKGENEIDIVAENELTDEAVFIEVKRKEENFDADVLNEKVGVFTRATGKFRDYAVSQKGLSMTDM